MSTMDDVPSHWISKASIAKRIGISRVTVDKQLARIEKDKELSGRLNVLIVDEGKRKLYFYDPSDVDAVFSELQKKSRRKSSNVKRSNSRVNDSVNLLDNAIVKLELQKEEIRRIALEKEVARLEDNLKDLRGENTFLKAQLTDQRPKPPSTAPESTEEAVVPPKLVPKLSNIVDIKKAMVDVDKPNVGTKDDSTPEDILASREKKASDELWWEEVDRIISEGNYSKHLNKAVESWNVEQFVKSWSKSTDTTDWPLHRTFQSRVYRRKSESLTATQIDVLKRCPEEWRHDAVYHKTVYKKVEDDIERRAEKDPYTLSTIPQYIKDENEDLIAKDAEPEAQPESSPIEDTQPTEEAPTEKEARRDNIAPKAEPQQYEKPKGFWAWIKGY